jgi:hypothetical protein
MQPERHEQNTPAKPRRRDPYPNVAGSDGDSDGDAGENEKKSNPPICFQRRKQEEKKKNVM